MTATNAPGDVVPDVSVDLEALGCGDLVMALLKAMRPLETGQILEARALDPGAAADIPAWCNMRKHELLAGPYGEEDALYYIRKGSS